MNKVKHFIPRSLLAILSSTIIMAAYADDTPQTIAKAMPGTDISSTTPSVIEGLYEVVAGNNVLYVDQSGRYLVIGSIYDLQEDIDLSAARRSEVAAAHTGSENPTSLSMEKLPNTAAIKTGRGKQSLTVITDPQCGWCRRLWLESLSTLEDVEINHLLTYESPQSVGILCAKDPAKALSQAFAVTPTSTKTPVPSPRCKREASEKIASVVRFAKSAGMLGTPILIREDGKVHAGYLGRSELLNWLGGNTDES